MSLVPYTPPPTMVAVQHVPPDLLVAVKEFVQSVVRPGASKWALDRLNARLAAARLAAIAAQEIAALVHRVLIGSAQCATEFERLQAEMELHIVRRIGLAYHAEELRLRGATLGDRIRDEAELDQLRRDVERAKLTAELDALQAAHAPAVRSLPALPSVTPHLDAEQAAATRARVERDARWIVEDVQAGHVPADPRCPYHAFAACIFVGARLEGASVPDAAAHARQIVIDRITSGVPIFDADLVSYKQQYDELKKRLDAAMGSRQYASVLAAMHRIGAAGVSANGNGGGPQ